MNKFGLWYSADNQGICQFLAVLCKHDLQVLKLSFVWCCIVLF